MRVSVVMPVHDEERFVREAVDSLLAQTFQDFELIVVDDGSTDATLEILQGYDDARLVLVRHQENRGYVHALNTGLDRVQGELIARQDADDISHPTRLARQVALLDERPNVVVVGCAYEVIDERGDRVRVDSQPATDTAIRWRALFHNPFAHSTVVLRVAALDGRRYEPELAPSEDYELWTHLLARGAGVNLGEPLVRYRAHPRQVSALEGERQERIADGIAQVSLAGIGIEVAPADIRRLRELSQALPERVQDDDLRLCAVLLDALSAFRRLRVVDEREATQIARDLVRRIAGRVPLRTLPALRGTGVLRRLLEHDPVAVAASLPRRAARRVLPRG